MRTKYRPEHSAISRLAGADLPLPTMKPEIDNREFYMKRDSNLSGNELYYTGSSSLVILMDLRSKFRWQKGLNFILF